MSNNIMLSVIIPVYNSEKYLKECIESLIKCKKNNIEFILINDGSTDSSTKICDKYHEKDSRIKVIHQKNGGVSNARNKGISRAKGKYLIFVDSDDVLEYGWERLFDLKMEKDIYYVTKNISKKTSKEKMLKYIVGFNEENFCFAGPFSKIFKTDFLKRNNILFREKLINGEDMLFNVNTLLNCETFEIINDTYYNYRKFQGSATKRFDNKIIESDKAFHQELYDVLKFSNIENKLINDISLYCVQMAIIVILNRIAYIKSYKESKQYFKFLEHELYSSAIKEEIKINKKFDIIFFLLKHNFNYLVYRCLRMLILINTKFGKEYYFIKI